MSAFWTSFFDGLTGEGIFGDLRIPGVPDRMFKPEPARELIVIIDEAGTVWKEPELSVLRNAVQNAVNETHVGGKVKVTVPETRAT
jgi:hypothetical protein